MLDDIINYNLSFLKVNIIYYNFTFETWCCALSLKDEHELMVLENKIMKMMDQR
jgi:hypothetical protein